MRIGKVFIDCFYTRFLLSLHRWLWLPAWREYCDKSTIQGIQYCGEVGRPLYEKIMWMAMIGYSIYRCGHALDTWDRWANPLAMTYAEKTMHILEIPFPAITICPSLKYNPDQFNPSGNLTRYADLVKLDLYAQLCLEGNHSRNVSYPSTSYDFEYAYEGFGFDRKDILHRAVFNGEPVHEFFLKTITEDGICYTFNQVQPSQLFRDSIRLPRSNRMSSTLYTSWNVERGFDRATVYPKRMYNIFQNGLGVVLKMPKVFAKTTCDQLIRGFFVTFHSPLDFPNEDSAVEFIPFHRLTKIEVSPHHVTSSQAIRRYGMATRHCYFNDERHLQNFKYYSVANCKVECLTNITTILCGCIFFWMPSE